MINKFPLPVFWAGSVVGIFFTYGLSIIAGVDIEKTEPVFHFYGIGFALGAITACIIIFLFLFINKQSSNNHQIKIKEGLNNG